MLGIPLDPDHLKLVSREKFDGRKKTAERALKEQSKKVRGRVNFCNSLKPIKVNNIIQSALTSRQLLPPIFSLEP